MATPLPDRLEWLHCLPSSPPDLPDAMAAVYAAYGGFEPPTHLRAQCFDDGTADAILRAARSMSGGGRPPPASFSQIYFEHPGCVGGEETIKLFLPRAIETLLTGPRPPGLRDRPRVVESALQSGFWFWPRPLVDSLRPLAARLFHDWFGHGRCLLPNWSDDGIPVGDPSGPGADILEFCAMTLIDPADCVAALGSLGTVQADTGILFAIEGATPAAPSYCSPDTDRGSDRYGEASARIAGTLASREARAVDAIVTSDWFDDAFFRNANRHPPLAEELSQLERYRSIRMMPVRQRAEVDMSGVWPALPTV